MARYDRDACLYRARTASKAGVCRVLCLPPVEGLSQTKTGSCKLSDSVIIAPLEHVLIVYIHVRTARVQPKTRRKRREHHKLTI